jgi:hypothetical protein
VLGELLVGVGVVDADRVVRDIELTDRIAALTERLAFGGSPAGEGFREPGKDDGPFAAVVGKLMSPAVGAGKIEAGGFVPHLQFDAARLPKPGNARHNRNRQTGRCREDCSQFHVVILAETRFR